jgi:hypothetical protein
MTHKDIHLHLHDHLHEHHHDDEHHCHHDHEHKHHHTHNDLELRNPTFDKHVCGKEIEPASVGGKCAPNEQHRQNQRGNVEPAFSLCQNDHESYVHKHGCHESSVEERCACADANNANGSDLGGNKSIIKKTNSGNSPVGKNLNNIEGVQFMAPQDALEKLHKENDAQNSDSQIRGSDSYLSQKLNIEKERVANKYSKSDGQNLEESN